MASRAKKPALDPEHVVLETPDASDHSGPPSDDANGDDENDSDLDDDDDDDSGSEMDAPEIDAEMQVDFEARGLQEKDFHGLVRLLVSMFRHHAPAGAGHNVDVSKLADQIIAQRTVGSVIIQGSVEDDSDDEEVQAAPGNEDLLQVDNEIFGVVTVVGLDRDGPPHIKAVIDLITKAATDSKVESNVNQLATLLGNKDNKVGLMIFERFMNLPPQLAVPSYDTLFNEVKKARAKRVPGFDFTHYMLLSKSMVATSGAEAAQGPIYHNPEEEVMLEKACMDLDLGSPSSVGGGDDAHVRGIMDGKSYLRRTRILVFRAEKSEELLDCIKAAFPL